MKKTFIIHPFLFAISPIFFLLSNNTEELSFSATLLPSAIVLGFTLLLLLLFRLIIKDNKKAAVIVSISLFLFFSYGHIYYLTEYWHIGGFSVGKHRYLIPIYGLIFIFSAYFIIKTSKSLLNFTKILNIMALSLVITSLVNIGIYEFKTKTVGQNNNQITEAGEANTTDLKTASVLPDIYYIILDGYAASDTLKKIYNYDNQGFINYLSAKGFYVPSKSRSNYAMTFLSLASSLNMQYINYLTDMVGIESLDGKAAYKMIDDNKIMNFLKSKGYKSLHFSSGWGATDHNQYADINFKCSGIENEFITLLLQTTIIYPFTKFFIAHAKRKRVLFTFSRLSEIYKIKGPKFIFAHIVSPHSPYVFGKNGEPVPDAELKMSGSVSKNRKNYLYQLIFINKKVKILVDEILSKSTIPPIIILQADHGTASTLVNSEDDCWIDNPTNDMLKERMRIFNAYYFPQGGNDLLYDSITPVNTFRLIFNLYFNTNYKLLDDLTYFSYYEIPYKFTDVTDKMKYD